MENIEFGMPSTRYKQKAEILFVTIPPTFLKFKSCFLFLLRQYDNKAVTNFVGNIITFFSNKNLFETLREIFATLHFFH